MKAIFFFIFIFSFLNLKSQLITDRPDQTESSSTVPKGALQLESGTQLSYEKTYSQEVQQLILPTNLFRFGISKNIEFRLVNQFETNTIGKNKHHGLSDLEIGTKIQLFKKVTSSTEIAFLSHLITPTGTEKVTNNQFQSVNKICISHEFNETVSLGYNLGYNYYGSGIGDFTYTFSLAIGVNEFIGIYLEPYGSIIELNTSIINADGGFTYLITPNTQLDFSFGTGINNKMSYIAFGCSWIFNKS